MINVVIADDHAIVRDCVRALLEAVGEVHVVGQATDGKEAVRLAVELNPDLVLMDISMPGMDGIEACERIGRQAPHSKVLMLSQNDGSEYLMRVLEAGAQGYVLKSSPVEELRMAIRSVMQGHVYLTPSMTARLVTRSVKRIEENPGKARPLSEREREVLRGICDGLTNQKIADELGISVKTVMAHRGNIMEKLDLHNRIDLVKYAIRLGLTTPDKAGADGSK
jgi:two-component system response regulator NreC